jgi:CBS domain-containing protein
MAESSQPETLTPRKLEEVIADQQGVLSPTDTVQKAGDKMRALHTEMLPVSEDRGLVGIVDEKDLDRTAAGFGHDPKVVLVGESMNREPIYCFEDQDAAEARRVMDAVGLDHLTIVDRQFRIVGRIKRQELDDAASSSDGKV